MIIQPASRIAEVRSYYFARKLAQIAKMNEAGADVLNLGIGSPDLLPPKDVITCLQEKSEHPTANKYQSYRGLIGLRTAFANWYQNHFDVHLHPEDEVLPLIGSKEGLMHIAMSFLENGDEALIPNPGYPAYVMTTQLAGATPVYYQLEEGRNWQSNLDQLAQSDLSKVKIMWLNYPNMPTGAKADKAYFKDLVDFAKTYQILLCHDNPYGFILNEKPISLLEIDGAKEVSLELNSLSKCYNMAGWRVGVLLGKAAYLNEVMKFKSNMDSGMYRPLQEAAIVALAQSDDWFDRINSIYKKRRKSVWGIMDLLHCSYDKNTAGLFVWGRIPDDAKSAEAIAEKILQEANVFITPGFIFGSQGARYLRISLCADEAVFENAKQRIEAFLKK